jgi:hypothetical protein
MPRPPRDPSVPLFAFELNPEKAELSAATVNIYKSALNKITAESYQQSLLDKRKKPILTKAALVSKPSRVVSIINTIGKDRQQKCVLFSAVFYAVGKKNITRNKKYNIIVEAFRDVYNNDEYKAYKEKKASEGTEEDG